MGIDNTIKNVSEFGITLVIVAVAIAYIVYYFYKLEPRLRQIEQNQIEDRERGKAAEEIIRNNSVAMQSMADSSKDVAKALENLTIASDKTNELNEKMLSFLIDKRGE